MPANCEKTRIPGYIADEKLSGRLFRVGQYTLKRLQEVWRQGGMMPQLQLENDVEDVDQVRQGLCDQNSDQLL